MVSVKQCDVHHTLRNSHDEFKSQQARSPIEPIAPNFRASDAVAAVVFFQSVASKRLREGVLDICVVTLKSYLFTWKLR